MGRWEGEKRKEGRFSPSALSLFRFHLSPFPPKRLIPRLQKMSISPSPPLPPGDGRGRGPKGGNLRGGGGVLLKVFFGSSE